MRFLNRIFILILTLSCHSKILAETLSTDIFSPDAPVSKNVDCFSWNFSSFDTWQTAMSKKYEKQFKDAAKRDAALKNFQSRFTAKQFDHYKSSMDCLNIVYMVDGLPVKGYVIKPKNTESQKLPVLIYNRGGNGNYGGVLFGKMMHDLFAIAEKGFIIIGSQYRGTFQKGGELFDEFGGRDVEDVVALNDLIPYLNNADEKRIGMFGSSRGGMQTFLAAKRMDNVKAIASIAGVVDLLKELEFRPKMENVFKKRIPNYSVNKEAELAKRSVINWYQEFADTPILLLHGDNDKRVSVRNAYNLAAKLEESQQPYEVVIYPNGSHGLFEHNQEKINKLTSWFHANL